MTSVGATQGIAPEVAASFSSGGFSNIFARPSYQSAAVSAYLTKLGSTNSGKFNTTGRGFPDIAAQGVDVEIVDGGETGTVDGTSCAVSSFSRLARPKLKSNMQSPIFASVISLLNDRLIAAGKSPLGCKPPSQPTPIYSDHSFLVLNPFLYSTGASALTDITSGDNPGCNTNGFPAAAGWDPITGLGTPNFAALLTAVGL